MWWLNYLEASEGRLLVSGSLFVLPRRLCLVISIRKGLDRSMSPFL